MTGLACLQGTCRCPAATPFFLNGRCRQCTANAHCTLPNTVCDTTSDCMCKCAAGWADCDANASNGCECLLATGVLVDANSDGVADKLQHCGQCGATELDAATVTCTDGQPACIYPGEASQRV